MQAFRRHTKVFLMGACVVVGLSNRAAAQVPFVQITLGDQPWEWSLFDCKPPNTIDTLEVVAHNFNMWLAGFDVQIVYPPALLFWEDLLDADLWLGSSPEGIAMVWQTPKSAFSAAELFRARVIWTGNCFCDGANPHQVVDVRGYPGSANPKAVRWPDYAEVELLGFDSLICADPPSPVRSTTWGAVKALYR